jgi:thermitase
MSALAPSSVAAQSVVATPPRPPVTQDAYPHVDSPPSAVGQQPHRGLKMTATSIGVKAVAERILVSFQAGLGTSDLAAINQAAAKLGAGAAKPVLQLRNGSYLVDVTGAVSVEAAAQAYRDADKRVVAASPDSIVGELEVPNDTFAGQWHLDKIRAYAAWNRSHGDGERIAILDTGIQDTHPDLAGKIDGGTNVLWSSSGTWDENGHGTGVAGIAAATTNNQFGIAGVGYNAHLLNVKVLYDGGWGSASGTATGIYWAVDHGADIINLSLAGDRDCNPWWIERVTDAGVQYLRDSIEYAWSRNVILVAGAGNTNTTGQNYPASCPHVLSVANSSHSDARTPGSTFGTWVSVAAPGEGIFTTAAAGGTHCNEFNDGHGFALCSGTSAASPVVAGVAALVRSSCGPETNQATVDRITSNADPIAGTGTDWRFGRVNAFRSVCITRPNGLAAISTTASSITVQWNDRSLETSFQFAYRLHGSGGLTTQILPANTTQYTATGLTAGVPYDFMVAACDAVGCSPFSDVLTTQANVYRLFISMTGFGRVTSTPAGINCAPIGPTCNNIFAANSQVSVSALGLVAPNQDENDFDQWYGACRGQGG